MFQRKKDELFRELFNAFHMTDDILLVVNNDDSTNHYKIYEKCHWYAEKKISN